jgi:DNA-binding NarL/FixJ family response regulator
VEKPLTTVLLADDHTMFREGLAGILTSHGGLEVVGETINDEGAVALAREKKPDVVIMQVQMPFEKAKEALKRMREVEPTPKVVIVTMFEDPDFLRDLLRLGASGYVLKSSSSRHLIAGYASRSSTRWRGTWLWACRVRCWRRPREGPRASSLPGS